MSNFKSLLLLIHYWFPIALGWSIAMVIHQATGSPILSSGITLYLLGIWAAYSFDRILDDPEGSRPHWLKVTLMLGFVISTGLGALLALEFSLQTLSVLVVFSVITLSYRKAKRFPFLKTLLVAITWTWAGVALPFSNSNWFAWQFWTRRTSVPLVLLIAAECILCDLKDLKFDQADGVRSMPVILGLRNTLLLTSVVLMAAALLSFEEGRMGLVASSLALLFLARFPVLLSLEAIGPLLVDLALTIPGLLISIHLV